MRITLKSYGAWEIITSESVNLPISGNDTANQAKLNSITECIIAISVDEKSFLYIINYRWAKNMWKKLESVYEQKSDISVDMLL